MKLATYNGAALRRAWNAAIFRAWASVANSSVASLDPWSRIPAPLAEQ